MKSYTYRTFEFVELSELNSLGMEGWVMVHLINTKTEVDDGSEGDETIISSGLFIRELGQDIKN